MKSIGEREADHIQAVMERREAEVRQRLESNPAMGLPRRPEPQKITVQPRAPYRRVTLPDGGGFITEPTEVSANDSWIQRRLDDETLEIVEQPEEQPPPPPPPPPPPEEQPQQPQPEGQPQ